MDFTPHRIGITWNWRHLDLTCEIDVIWNWHHMELSSYGFDVMWNWHHMKLTSHRIDVSWNMGKSCHSVVWYIRISVLNNFRTIKKNVCSSELTPGHRRLTHVNPMGGGRGRGAISSNIMRLQCFRQKTAKIKCLTR